MDQKKKIMITKVKSVFSKDDKQNSSIHSPLNTKGWNWEKKVPKKSARFNSSYHNKPITQVIKAKPTWVSLSNPQPRPWNQNNFIKKENKEKHLC
jgi:hypothetical protein